MGGTSVKTVLRHYQQSQTSRGKHRDLTYTQDWTQCYGREEELQTIESWILEDSCRVIAPRTAIGAIRLLDSVG